MYKVKITERPKTVRVTDQDGRVHTGRWNDNEEVFEVSGDGSLLKAALHAWTGRPDWEAALESGNKKAQNEFEISAEILHKCGGGWA